MCSDCPSICRAFANVNLVGKGGAAGQRGCLRRRRYENLFLRLLYNYERDFGTALEGRFTRAASAAAEEGAAASNFDKTP